jgi:hypothetical protein
MFDEFLNKLVGSWSLTGNMGSTGLKQKVNARWVIQGQFLEVHCMDEGSVTQSQPLYEAVYMLGYDSQTKEYSMHLFDTFGASFAQTVGVGKRHGDSVEFLFEYPSNLFSNTFTWHQETGEWEMLLRQKEENDNWKVFAKKTITRE